MAADVEDLSLRLFIATGSPRDRPNRDGLTMIRFTIRWASCVCDPERLQLKVFDRRRGDVKIRYWRADASWPRQH